MTPTGRLAIEQEFPVRAPAARCFALASTAAGLDGWWTLAARLEARVGATAALDFGPGHAWAAEVVACDPPTGITYRMTASDDDWRGTTVRLAFDEAAGVTTVRFTHAGWREANRHYRVTAHCWALYLRHFRRLAEEGVVVPYAQRLDA